MVQAAKALVYIDNGPIARTTSLGWLTQSLGVSLNFFSNFKRVAATSNQNRDVISSIRQSQLMVVFIDNAAIDENDHWLFAANKDALVLPLIVFSSEKLSATLSEKLRSFQLDGEVIVTPTVADFESAVNLVLKKHFLSS